MISVLTWHWTRPGGPAFSPVYVDRLRSMLARNLRLPHELVLVTDRPQAMRAAIDGRVRILPMPLEHAHTPRCRRRMWNFAAERAQDVGPRILCCDLDVVITGDVTPLLDRPEPLVCWRVGYANVYSGSFLLMDAGVLDGAWRAYRAAPEAFPAATGERNVSDQAMLNHWLAVTKTKPAEWTERDGLITWFGKGYERLEHLGMGPKFNKLRPGTRVVVLGSADKAVMDDGRYPFVAEHWR